MDTLLTYEKLKTLGFKLSVNLDQNMVNQTIEDIERKFVKANIDFYPELVVNEGGKFDTALSTILQGIGNLVFGNLLVKNFSVTRFGAVKKTTDYSLSVQRSDANTESAEYFARGTSLIREGFDELLEIDGTLTVKGYPYYNFFKGFYTIKNV